jgi:hypothetical protein
MLIINFSQPSLEQSIDTSIKLRDNLILEICQSRPYSSVKKQVLN